MSDTATLPVIGTEEEQKTRRAPPIPPYHVILLNDDDHSYHYVIRMLKELFGHPEERGMQMAREVDEHGKVIVLTTSLEHAELKRDQIHAYGADPLLEKSKGSMSAIIEPAE
jgi:ATP-dependent Clp protease adaptor protein ClpS